MIKHRPYQPEEKFFNPDLLSKVLEEDILAKVTKPARYSGGEWNQAKKDWNQAKVRTAFAFPDLYEVAMSHLGLRILYHLVNEQPGRLMERIFAPGVDLEEKMRSCGMPLFSLESRRPLQDFDLIGFTLQYEMSYTNILNMLDLGGFSPFVHERDDDAPLIVAGGPCAVNPEPLASFVDCFVLGEGEEVLLEVLDAVEAFQDETGWRKTKHTAKSGLKVQLLERLAAIRGVYVPQFYQPQYGEDGSIKVVQAIKNAVPAKVTKRIVKDLNHAYFPMNPLVPATEVVHDRIMLEVLRGCTRACRFCQAGSIYRPVRERQPEVLREQAKQLIKSTGYDEIALTSLSTADYTCVEPLLKELVGEHGSQGVGVSLPSLRVDAFSVELAKEVQKVRKTGLTFAPEAGSQRMRDVINKGVTEKDLMEVAEGAFRHGWTSIKLYFMIGLPTEQKEDIEGIALLAEQVAYRGTDILRELGIKKGVRVTVSTSSFVPKPQTPFQWEPQDRLEDLEEKQQYLKKRLRDRRIQYSWHDARLSFLEAVVAKGDRRVGQAIFLAWKKGCKFDGWSEHFNYDKWLEAFQEAEIDPEFFAYRSIGYDEVLPWDHLDFGVSKQHLIKEHRKALEAALTGDCRLNNCSGCGVCPALGASVKLVTGQGGVSPWAE